MAEMKPEEMERMEDAEAGKDFDHEEHMQVMMEGLEAIKAALEADDKESAMELVRQLLEEEGGEEEAMEKEGDVSREIGMDEALESAFK